MDVDYYIFAFVFITIAILSCFVKYLRYKIRGEKFPFLDVIFYLSIFNYLKGDRI